jgi:hypothetical protein
VTPRDRVWGPSGRRGGAGDVVHRQAVPTPSAGPHTRPEGRVMQAFGQRRAKFTMPRSAAPYAPWYYLLIRSNRAYGGGVTSLNEKSRLSAALRYHVMGNN